MGTVQVTAEKDFLEGLATSKPVKALSELIWNSLDANSTKVQVFLDLNDLGGIDKIRIRDDGSGIDYNNVNKLFGSLGDSWKKAKSRQGNRVLHGKNGKGRFKAFALGSYIEWDTTYKSGTKLRFYKITGSGQTLNNFDTSDSCESKKGSLVGTEVTISNLHQSFRLLEMDSVTVELTKIFATYLTEYPEVTLEYNGTLINPATAQSYRKDYHLGDIDLGNERKASVEATVIEWNIKTDRATHLCDATGITLCELPDGRIQAPGFNFTIYLKSDHFRELDKKSLLDIADLHEDVKTIWKIAKNKIKEHFRLRSLENRSQIVDRWKNESIYPYDDKKDIDPVEVAERQVFDILAVNVQSYLPVFEEADIKSKKFTFRLLAQAVRDNPESVQKIIVEVLGLKKDEQDDLADLLEKTNLSSIISSSKIVANRLNFLNGLESLLFDMENKKQLLERDQLHKILEKEAWLFHEDFALAGSEQRLEEVLQKHLDKLGKREDVSDPVILSDGKRGRVDLMLHKVTSPRTGEYDYLIVELKRPSKKIDDGVLSQIKQYAVAVAQDERFRGVPAKWTFLAISNELDPFAKRDSNQRGRPKGQVYDDDNLNITVWAKEWADVINNARSRLQFIGDLLSYEADHDSAKSYLKKTHNKFIPALNDTGDQQKESRSNA